MCPAPELLLRPHNATLCAGGNVTAYIWQKGSCALGTLGHKALSNRHETRTGPLFASPMTAPRRYCRSTLLKSPWDTILLHLLRSPGFGDMLLGVSCIGLSFLATLLLLLSLFWFWKSLSRWEALPYGSNKIDPSLSSFATEGGTLPWADQSENPTHLSTVIGCGMCMWASWANQSLLWDFCWSTKKEVLCLNRHCLL